MPRSDWQLVSNCKFYFPKNSTEASKVANVISKLDHILSLQQRKLEQLKHLKTVMLQNLFADKDSKRPTWRFIGFHSEWSQHTLKELSKTTYSGLNGKTKSDFGHGNARYITYLNVHDNEIAKSDGVDRIEIDTKQNKVTKGDLLFTISSEVPEEVALNSVWPSENISDVYLNSFCFGIKPQPKIVNSFFLTYYLRSPNMRRAIYPLAQGISRFNVSKTSILSLDVNIPEIKEQINIYKVLKEVNQILELQQSKIMQLTTLKKYLLQKLFI